MDSAGGRTKGNGSPHLVLKASGSELTGSWEDGRGGAVDISDCTIDGNNVSFKVIREYKGNQFTQQYKGTLLDAGELNLTVSMGGGGRSGGTGGAGFGGGKGGRGGQGGQRNLVFKRAAN